MTREALLKWLNVQVGLYHAVQENQTLYTENDVEYCSMLSSYTDGIHITHPIVLARLLDTQFEVEKFDDVEYPYKVSFMYSGVKFFGLYTKEEFENE